MNPYGNQPKAKYNRRALSAAEGRRAILNRIRPLEALEVDLLEAVGRRLAEDVRTMTPVPHFRRSGMDGFAVRSADIEHATAHDPACLEVVEHIPCGVVPKLPVAKGQASRIMTGGMVPDGANAVIMLEMTETEARDGRECVLIRKTDARGANITPIGAEAGKGDVILKKGHLIGAGETAVLAAMGYSRVPVFRKPVVAVLSTGTELLQVHEPLVPGKIRNSNAYMLASQIRSAGADARLCGSIPDDYEQAKRIIDGLLSSGVDIVLTTGGVSVGDYDIMADFFLKWDGVTLFNKVAMRPGSPTTAGAWREKLVFGLSGNPSACFVGFELFVRPAIIAMQEGLNPEAKTVTAFLEENYMKVNAYTRYVRGEWQSHKGQNWVKPVGLDQSSASLSIKDANCLIVLPPTKTGYLAGELVEVIPL